MSKAITKTNTVETIVKSVAKFGFKPGPDFYLKTSINKKRWPTLVNGNKEPTLTELKAICAYFEVDLKDYID